VVDIREEGNLGRKGSVETREKRGRSFGCRGMEMGVLNIKLLVTVAMSGLGDNQIERRMKNEE